MRSAMSLRLAAAFLGGCSSGPQPGDVAPATGPVTNGRLADDPDALHRPSASEWVRDRAEDAGAAAYDAATAAVAAVVLAPVYLFLRLTGLPLPFGK